MSSSITKDRKHKTMLNRIIYRITKISMYHIECLQDDITDGINNLIKVVSILKINIGLEISGGGGGGGRGGGSIHSTNTDISNITNDMHDDIIEFNNNTDSNTNSLIDIISKEASALEKTDPDTWDTSLKHISDNIVNNAESEIDTIKKALNTFIKDNIEIVEIDKIKLIISQKEKILIKLTQLLDMKRKELNNTRLYGPLDRAYHIFFMFITELYYTIINENTLKIVLSAGISVISMSIFVKVINSGILTGKSIKIGGKSTSNSKIKTSKLLNSISNKLYNNGIIFIIAAITPDTKIIDTLENINTLDVVGGYSTSSKLTRQKRISQKSINRKKNIH
jgi:hypothetical protein